MLRMIPKSIFYGYFSVINGYQKVYFSCTFQQQCKEGLADDVYGERGEERGGGGEEGGQWGEGAPEGRGVQGGVEEERGGVGGSGDMAGGGVDSDEETGMVEGRDEGG